jgi:TetR/AcrR family transcriptional repressor of nem operon
MPYAPEHKQKTRERIVEAAARLFNRKGFAEVTIGEFMTAAGLTHGGFYRHFASKEELYAESVRHFLKKEVPARWQKGPRAHACPTGRLRSSWSTPTCRPITWRT